MPDDIKVIVQRMIDAGESEENIATVIQHAKSQEPPTGWAAHPNLASVARGALGTLPALGAIAGGVMAAPGLSTGLPGLALEAGAVGLGAGAGRGARDLIAEGIGLDKPTSPASKALRIGVDTALAGGTQAVLPGVIEAVKTPLRTLKEMPRPTVPPWLRQFASHTEGLKLAPVEQPVLARPQWQSRAVAAVADEVAPAGAGSQVADQVISDADRAAMLKRNYPESTIAKLEAQMSGQPRVTDVRFGGLPRQTVSAPTLPPPHAAPVAEAVGTMPADVTPLEAAIIRRAGPKPYIPASAQAANPGKPPLTLARELVERRSGPEGLGMDKAARGLGPSSAYGGVKERLAVARQMDPSPSALPPQAMSDINAWAADKSYEQLRSAMNILDTVAMTGADRALTRNHLLRLMGEKMAQPR